MPPARKRPSTLSVVKSLLEDSSLVNSEQLLSDIIQEWGGTRALARDIKKAFDKAPEGSMTRQRFFEMFQRLIISNTDRDIAREVDPSEFSDEELAQAAAGILGRAGVKDGEEADAAAVSQRGVEDELQRPDRETEPQELDAAGAPDADDGGWGAYGI